jgi:hypothetical protein
MPMDPLSIPVKVYAAKACLKVEEFNFLQEDGRTCYRRYNRPTMTGSREHRKLVYLIVESKARPIEYAKKFQRGNGKTVSPIVTWARQYRPTQPRLFDR